MEDWYLEYRISRNRLGLLGDIASMLGMLDINIVTVSGVDNIYRGFLIQTADRQKIAVLRAMMRRVSDITLTALRRPTLIDRLALRHGQFIRSDSEENQRVYRFLRTDIGLLVDFLGEVLKRDGRQVIGVRGMPRVGKTEAIIAASVYANKRWTVISSTLLRQTVRQELAEDEYRSEQMVYIMDGAVSTRQADERHLALVRETMRLPAPIVIEHPDVFVQHTEYGWDTFDRIIELRHHPEDEIAYEALSET